MSELPELKQSRQWQIFMGFAVIAMAIAVFLPGSRGGFVYDDKFLMNHEILTAPGGWWKSFVFSDVKLYRPITTLMFHLDYQLWGWNPTNWHLHSLLWHGICSSMVFMLIRRLRFSYGAAFLGATWFAIHPVHAEAAVWISSRGSVLSTTGVLGCLICYWQWLEEKSPKMLTACLGFGILAILSKEDALMLFPLLALSAYGRDGACTISTLKQKIVTLPVMLLCLVAFIYLVMRSTLISGLQQGERIGGWLNFVSTLPLILTTYLGQLIYPAVLSIDQAVDNSGAFGLSFWMSVLLLGVIVLTLALRGDAWRLWKWCIAWFFITLFPVMGFIPINQPQADRFLYMPSVAGAVCLAILWQQVSVRWPRYLTILGLALSLWIGALACRAWSYSKSWLNEQALWENVLKTNPKSYRAWANLASSASNAGDPQQGLQLIGKALSIKPDYLEGFVIKAFILDQLKQYPAAEALYRQALRGQPEQASWLYFLANNLELQNRPVEAEVVYDQITTIKPGYAEARLAAGVLAAQMGKTEKAIAHWEAVLKVDPSNQAAQQNLKRIRAKKS